MLLLLAPDFSPKLLIHPQTGYNFVLLFFFKVYRERDDMTADHELLSIFTVETYNSLCPLSHWILLSFNILLHPRVRKWIFYLGPGLVNYSEYIRHCRFTWWFVQNLLHWNTWQTHVVLSRIYPSDHSTAHSLLGKFSFYSFFFSHNMNTAKIGFHMLKSTFTSRLIVALKADRCTIGCIIKSEQRQHVSLLFTAEPVWSRVVNVCSCMCVCVWRG